MSYYAEQLKELEEENKKLKEMFERAANTIMEMDKEIDELEDKIVFLESVTRSQAIKAGSLVECPSSCPGCSCHIASPCPHCTEGHGQIIEE